jgi:hypothetical protein
MLSNTRLTAENNEITIIFCLHRFGWLKTRQIAALVWPKSADGGGYSMAQRTLRRLKLAHKVIPKLAPDGATIYALGRGGAKLLHDYEGLEHAKTTRDCMRSLPTYDHRALANDIAITWINKGNTTWTEHEIQAGRAPVKVLRGKIPDVLLDWSEQTIAADGEVVLAWVEVENSWKSNRDMDKLLGFFCAVLGAVDGQGLPRAFREPIDSVTSLGYGLIVVHNTGQMERIIRKLTAKKAAEPYEYDWVSIESELYIQVAAKSLKSVSQLLDEYPIYLQPYPHA